MIKGKLRVAWLFVEINKLEKLNFAPPFYILKVFSKQNIKSNETQLRNMCRFENFYYYTSEEVKYKNFSERLPLHEWVMRIYGKKSAGYFKHTTFLRHCETFLYVTIKYNIL